MELPRISDNQFKERLGVCAVERKLTEMRCIWRETRNTDVGIDGQVEFVDDDGLCTGHVLAAQVKAGSSYFSEADADYFFFYPENKHRRYWERFPLPVMLILYDPDSDIAYWVDARRYLRSPSTAGEPMIRVPRANTLNTASRSALLETFGSFGDKLLDIDGVVRELAQQKCAAASFNISYLELFGFGLTDICRKLFFSMKLCIDIAEPKAATQGLGLAIGAEEFEFVSRYIRFLIAQNLIFYDFSDFLIDWEDRELVPTFLCPLSRRGVSVIDRLQSLRAGLFHERPIGIDFMSEPLPLDEVDRLAAELCGYG